MGLIEDRIQQLGFQLPPPLVVPAGVVLPFEFVRIHGNRAYVSGHGPQGPDGQMAGPFGLVGRDLSEEQAVEAAHRTGLSILGSLHRALGSLDRIQAWLRVFGMVAAAEGFERQPAVINGFSDLIIRVFGPERGAHARSAIGVASLPFSIPVEIEATVEISV